MTPPIADDFPAIAAAVATRGAPPALAGADDPDAEMISLCDRLVAGEAAKTAIYATMDGTDDDALDAAMKLFRNEWRAIEARLYDIGAPRTPQGIMAMARAAVALCDIEPDGSVDADYLGDWLAINVAACVARSRS
jgi:hypothetical protein